MNDDILGLLDKSFDDIADLPEFKVPDTGMYRLKIGFSTKEINKKPSAVANFTVREVVELADSAIEESARAKAGDKFDIPFILKDEDGKDSEVAWGLLKQLTEPFKAHYGTDNLKVVISKLMEDTLDITAKVVKKQRKDDKDKYGAQVSDITID